MSRSTYMFATKEDNSELLRAAHSFGLWAIAPLVEHGQVDPDDDPAIRPFCYLSVVDPSSLHPHGSPAGVTSATDPLIELLRSYCEDSYIIMGRMHWSDDVPELARITKPCFNKLQKWIRDNWTRNSDGQYIGTSAQRALDRGAKLAYLPAGISLERVP